MFRYRNPLIACSSFVLLGGLLAATPSMGAPRVGVFANDSAEAMSIGPTGANDSGPTA